MNYNDLIKKLSLLLVNINNRDMQVNLVREELQKDILYSIYSLGHDLYFLGGTNLRICYKLDRFSEDLDFSILKPDLNYNINVLAKGIIDNFNQENGYDISIKYGKVETVQKMNIKIGNILYDLGISPLKDEKIMIKIEIDTNPSLGATYSKEIIESNFGTFILKNQDIESTFSGKIGALLLREYTKGRDYYDLYWYFSNFSHKKFNREYISNIIIQYNQNNNKNKTIPKTHKETLNMILEKLENTNYNKVKEDLKRFLDWSNDKLDLFFEKYNENMIRMIKTYNDNIENDTKNTKTFRL